ncbi:hypothetical protein GCM10009847_18000 [Leucobacter tardus]
MSTVFACSVAGQRYGTMAAVEGERVLAVSSYAAAVAGMKTAIPQHAASMAETKRRVRVRWAAPD